MEDSFSLLKHFSCVPYVPTGPTSPKNEAKRSNEVYISHPSHMTFLDYTLYDIFFVRRAMKLSSVYFIPPSHLFLLEALSSSFFTHCSSPLYRPSPPPLITSPSLPLTLKDERASEVSLLILSSSACSSRATSKIASFIVLPTRAANTAPSSSSASSCKGRERRSDLVEHFYRRRFLQACFRFG